jgi:hypothetical protein
MIIEDSEIPLWYYRSEQCKIAYEFSSSGIIPTSGYYIPYTGGADLYTPIFDRYYQFNFSSASKYYWECEEINKFVYEYRHLGGLNVQ